jgi:putative membrane protein
VPSRIATFFSDADREAIRAATAAAESKTTGELVVYVAERCDPHPETRWKAALIGGAVGALSAAIAVWLFGGWGAPDYVWLLIGLQLGLLVGWLASRFDGVARRLIGDDALSSRVEGRAAEAFLDEQVFATRDRTGILIFVALFEHRVLVLADEGIDERVYTR